MIDWAETALTEQVVDLSISLPAEETVVTVILLADEVVGGLRILFMENEKDPEADIVEENTEVTSIELLSAKHDIELVNDPDIFVQVIESLVTGGYEDVAGLFQELG